MSERCVSSVSVPDRSMPRRSLLTRSNVPCEPQDGHDQSRHIMECMSIDGRDRVVVQWVARFGQLSSSHIRELVFHGVASATSSSRSLRRLVSGNYLLRIERRMVGGSKGGSGQYVYALARKGYYLFHTGRFNPARAINYHSLAIADSFVILKRLERSGRFDITGMSTEPDCHVSVGRYDLTPDMALDIATHDGSRIRLWLEVDMATETQTQLKAKLERYWKAYNEADVAVWPIFPKIIFVAVDEQRAKELRWLISQGSIEAQSLFDVCTRATLARIFQA